VSAGAVAAPAAPTPSRWRHLYVKAVIVAGAVVLAALVMASPPRFVVLDRPWPYLCLIVALLIGELRPVPISRGDDTSDQLTTSTAFVIALLLLGPASVAAVALALAVTVDDLSARRPLLRAAYNSAQYVLSVGAALLALTVVGGQPHLVHGAVEVHVFAGLAAGAVFVFVNHLLIAMVITLHSGQPFLRVVTMDARFSITISGVLVALAPLAAFLVQADPLMLLLLCSPIAAVYRSAKQAMSRQQQALHDGLTGLANRELLQQRLARLLEEAPAGPSVLLIDLDHFKDINDTLGHHVGDALLVSVAERLSCVVGEDGLVARLGGDEFAIVVPEGRAAAQDLAGRVLGELGKPADVAEVRLLVQGSIGVAVAPDDGHDVMTLLKHADTALYEAKEQRARYAFYRPERDVNTVERLELLTDLRAAIEENQLFVLFQPKLDVASGRTIGVEALVRWQHPTRGLVPPDMFIELAENSGLIGFVTAHVLAESLDAVARWRELGHDLHVAVNLSARHLSDLALPDMIQEALHAQGVPASRLTLEVTETAIMSDPARADTVVKALRDTGVSIAVDDYGTGHASLSYLKRLDVDELKIDRSFVTDMRSDPSDAIIVRSTIELGHALGLHIVAEGVEDGETLGLLRDLGCDVAQGWHIGRPETFADVAARLMEERTIAAPTAAHAGATP
jgi:diguanylate cyclase (GGDEF)-like protein